MAISTEIGEVIRCGPVTFMEHFSTVELRSLQWPEAFTLPSRRFRLLVAADVIGVDSGALRSFAQAALERGMVYFCAWGSDCERFHDIADEVIVADELGDRRFVGPMDHDTIMTTWHAKDSLEDALWYFKNCALPSEGFISSSEHWVVVSVGHPEWAAIARRGRFRRRRNRI